MHIKATTDNIFEHLEIYVNDTLLVDVKDVESYEGMTLIHETTTIKAVGTIMGATWTREETITRKDGELMIVSGSTLEEALSKEDAVKINYDRNHVTTTEVSVDNEGDKIFVLLKSDASTELRRQTMSGFDIPMSKQQKDGWLVYESENTYKAGVYGITIE